MISKKISSTVKVKPTHALTPRKITASRSDGICSGLGYPLESRVITIFAPSLRVQSSRDGSGTTHLIITVQELQ